MSNGALPDGWAWATSSEVCTQVQDGTHFSPEVQYDGPAEGRSLYLTAKNIRWSGIDLSEVTYVDDEVRCSLTERCSPAEGDVLIVKDGVNTGMTAINTLREPFCFLSSVALLRPEARTLSPRYLKHYLCSPEGLAATTGQMSGSAIRRIILQKLRGLLLPIAPLAEQRRIVAKIEELFSLLDAAVAGLERARANLKRYRASVLKAAVEGRLTEEWRAKHLDTEPASVLLERILQERRRKWEEDQLAKYAGKGQKPPANWRSKYKGPEAPDTEGLGELPEGWVWASVEQVGEVRLGRQRSPRNRAGRYATKYIRAANITWSGLDLSDVMEMDFRPSERAVYELKPGDLVLSEASGSVDEAGKPAIWTGEIEGCCFQNTVIRLRPAVVSSRFLLTVFRHFAHNKVFASVAHGVGIHHIGAERFALVPVPLVPVAEQTEIVAEVERRLSVVEEIRAEVEAGLKRAARLRQAILKRAFEGKLVPQDPDDEPASVLLQRIRAEREAQPARLTRARTAGTIGTMTPDKPGQCTRTTGRS